MLTWLKYTGIQALQNFAHAVLGVLGGNAINVLHIDWVGVLAIGAGAALISVLTSIVNLKIQARRDGEAESPCDITHQG